MDDTAQATRLTKRWFMERRPAARMPLTYFAAPMLWVVLLGAAGCSGMNTSSEYQQPFPEEAAPGTRANPLRFSREFICRSQPMWLPASLNRPYIAVS